MFRKALAFCAGIALFCASLVFFTHDIIGALIAAPTLGLLFLLWQLRRFEILLKEKDPAHPEIFNIFAPILNDMSQLRIEREERGQAHKKQTKRVDAILSGLPCGVVRLNNKNQLIWINRTAELMLGIDANKDMGHPLTNLIRNPSLRQFLKQSAKPNAMLEFEPPENENRHLAAHLIGHADERIMLLLDQSNPWRLEKMQREYLANVSHELRTPLSIIMGYIEMLLSEIGEPQAEKLRIANLHAKKIQNLLDDILTLAYFEESPALADNDLPALDAPALLRGIIEDLETVSGRDITLNCDDKLGLRAHKKDLQIVFSNLIGNAIHYSIPNTEILVAWRVVSAGVEFSVHDKGPGIDYEHLPRLTERFYRAERGRDSGTSATGLGLAIVKNAMQHYHGQLLIDSKRGRGSSFSCIFPEWLKTQL
ncbi:MAG: ATP-binding protein [Candidatus Eutrophobiaceae bacterium]